jgi:hypothetical protein
MKRLSFDSLSVFSIILIKHLKKRGDLKKNAKNLKEKVFFNTIL